MKVEAIFSPGDRARLTPCVEKRYACRSFGEPLSLADWSALSYAAGRYTLPGVRLMLMRVDADMFGDALSNVGQITGCTAIAAIIVQQFERGSRILAGLAGEALCLEATALGLASCWVTGGYRRRMLNLPLKSGESLMAVIALGHPAMQIEEAIHRRKPLELITRTDAAAWPVEAQRAAALVQLAPSAMNAQPWLMNYADNRFTLDVTDRAQPELGIALCHAELALTTPHHWQTAAHPGDPAAWVVWG